MMTDDVVIAGGVRTPIGSLGGQFRDTPAVRLGSVAIAEALRRTGVSPEQTDETIMGNVLQAGLGQNPARQAALAAGIPVGVPAMTVNKVCGSGLKAVALAYQSIRCGDGGIVVAGGMENMSMAPYLLPGVRYGYRLGHRQAEDAMLRDGLWCAENDCHMGETAERICTEYGFGREQLDRFAADSQRKAQAAAEAGKWSDEIAEVRLPQKKGEPLIVQTDEYPRPDTTPETLAKLRPAFKPNGMVTAGNASGINDGAAALVVMSGRKAAELGIEPLAAIRSFAAAGVDPALMGLGPIPATERALAKAGLTISDVDLFEVNEAFASQALAYVRHFDIPPDKFNVNGGAIALGHPIGASGARVLVTLLHEMRRRNARYGLCALCIGGGQGIAVVLERGRSA